MKSKNQLSKKISRNLTKIVSSFLSAKKSFAKKIFGSNLYLSAKKISGLPQTQWAAWEVPAF